MTLSAGEPVADRRRVCSAAMDLLARQWPSLSRAEVQNRPTPALLRHDVACSARSGGRAPEEPPLEIVRNPKGQVGIVAHAHIFNMALDAAVLLSIDPC